MNHVNDRALLKQSKRLRGTDRAGQGAQQVLRALLIDDGSALTSEPRPYLEILWQVNPEIHDILSQAPELESARATIQDYLARRQREILSSDSDLHPLKMATVRECIRAMVSIVSPANEELVEMSALEHLWHLARGEPATAPLSNGFLLEFIYLFRGLAGQSNIYDEGEDVLGELPDFLQLSGREAAQRRMEILDAMAASMDHYLTRYPTGLGRRAIRRRELRRARILELLGGSEEDWHDFRWHLTHVIKKPDLLVELIDLSDKELAAIRKAVEHRIPFGITPYYLSLMDTDRSFGQDQAIRAQVIPPPDYVNMLADHRQERRAVFDFMGEQDTSPVDLVTRRYPRIAILKPFNTCSQICVYCQRNWEIDECMAPGALAPERKLAQALGWLRRHPAVNEVLITGGDPMVMPDDDIRRLLERVCNIEHVHRVRIGTRTPVVLPQRWTQGLAELIAEFHEPGQREVAIVTHFQHPYEITPEAMEAVQLIRRQGMGVYNQQVFNIWNSRRFETCKLRQTLRRIGVDPYYTFNMKGKEETERYIAPIARLLQERKEEARLLPGLDRTDEPVFNVPRLGKNHLRLWQDHRLLTIRTDGRRVYSFHPWEKNITLVPPYYYEDVSIYDYLQQLAAMGEDLREYRTIWYYF